MRLLLRVILILGVLGAMVQSSMFNQSPANADQLDKEISEIQAELYRRANANMRLSELKHAISLQAGDFACTGGIDPSKMAATDYMKAFASGPCTPVVVLAGMSGTKLQVLIDCETLKQSNPKLFNQCRWTSCTGCSTNIIGNTPKPEYTIWIPDLTSPFSLANPKEHAKECLAGLSALNWVSQGGKLTIKAQAGVKILPMGMTSETITTSKCGFESISNILPVWQVLSPEKFKIFNALRLALEAKGYRIGLTATAIPYDWRIPFSHNAMERRMVKILELMKSITGKKISIIAHSMGNMNTLNMLSKIDQKKKDQLIQRYFAMAPPFCGSPKAFAMLLGGNDELNLGNFGINFWEFKNMAATFTSTYDLMPRTFWSRFDNTPWMKSIRNRIRVESGLSPLPNLSFEDDVVTKYFPKTDVVCKEHDWTDRAGTCKSGLVDMKTFGRVMGDTLSVDNLKYILGRYSFDPMAQEHFYDGGKRDQYDLMPNPGVETVIIFSSILKTEHEYNYDFDPKPKAIAETDDFVYPSSVSYALGDGTVISASAIGPGFKWAWEFDKKNVPGAKPVIFAEVCSNYNQASNVYQDEASRLVTRTTYKGISCSCKKGTEGNCDHIGLVSDPGAVAFIVNSLMDKQSATSPKYFDSWSSIQIDEFAKRCALANDLV
jgi:Lecithin:cholesterol acyltransferase